jgi:hypothetical protein
MNEPHRCSLRSESFIAAARGLLIEHATDRSFGVARCGAYGLSAVLPERDHNTPDLVTGVDPTVRFDDPRER